MFNRNEYLEKHCRKVSSSEAQAILDKGNRCVTSGGYTYLKTGEFGTAALYPRYFACGTFPGCLRGGDVSCVSIKQHRERDWYVLTLRDVIILHGFFPCPFSTGTVAVMQAATHEYDVHIEDMVEKMIDSDKDTKFFKSGRAEVNTWWQDYFVQKDATEELKRLARRVAEDKPRECR